MTEHATCWYTDCNPRNPVLSTQLAIFHRPHPSSQDVSKNLIEILVPIQSEGEDGRPIILVPINLSPRQLKLFIIGCWCTQRTLKFNSMMQHYSVVFGMFGLQMCSGYRFYLAFSHSLRTDLFLPDLYNWSFTIKANASHLSRYKVAKYWRLCRISMVRITSLFLKISVNTSCFKVVIVKKMLR
jgi:hypothetical protein